MTLAQTARIHIDPAAVLRKKGAHDLAHAFARARRRAHGTPEPAMRAGRLRRPRG